MTSRDDYVTITTVLREVRDLSVFIDVHRGAHGRVSIPRSLLFGPDDLHIAEAGIGCEIKLRIRRWKAEELGLLPDQNKPQRDLFGGSTSPSTIAKR